jgi:aconitase B
MKFMNDFGLITARDPKGEYLAMTDVIHKVLNDITVDEWIIIGGDSHTRMSKGVAFGADSEQLLLHWLLVRLQCQFRVSKSYIQRRYENLYGFP